MTFDQGCETAQSYFTFGCFKVQKTSFLIWNFLPYDLMNSDLIKLRKMIISWLHLNCRKRNIMNHLYWYQVRLAEWSKAPDLSSGTRKRAWVRTPHLTKKILQKNCHKWPHHKESILKGEKTSLFTIGKLFLKYVRFLW